MVPLKLVECNFYGLQYFQIHLIKNVCDILCSKLVFQILRQHYFCCGGTFPSQQPTIIPEMTDMAKFLPNKSTGTSNSAKKIKLYQHFFFRANKHTQELKQTLQRQLKATIKSMIRIYEKACQSLEDLISILQCWSQDLKLQVSQNNKT